jgi:hypothetical protein
MGLMASGLAEPSPGRMAKSLPNPQAEVDEPYLLFQEILQTYYS